MTFSRIRGNSSDEKMVHPNHIVYRKMEMLINQMLNGEDSVPIKTVKSFLSKIPSVFTGQDIVAWILRNVEVADIGDALHLAHLLSSHGYVFQIDDHVLTVKNDGTFYRFQTPYFWPSNCWEPENTDYAVYLCKRTMQNKAHLELEDFEAENLAKLQKLFSRKWEFVFMQAEAQYKVDKKRDRLERQILDSQERAFWDVHRPVPGCVNTTEVDFRKLSRSGRPKYSASNNSVHAATCNADCQTHHQHMLRCAMMDSSPSTSANAVASSTAAAATAAEAARNAASGIAPQPAAGTSNANGTLTRGAGAAAGGAGAGSFKSGSSLGYRDSKVYHQRPGLRRCTHMTDTLKYEIGILQNRLAKNVLKTSKVIENYLQYYDHRKVFDAFFIQLGSPLDPFQGQPNPWISDTVDFWQHDKLSDLSCNTGDISTRRLKLWEESFEELLSDVLGRETLQKFLDKEYSGENLRFWWEVQKLRKCSCRMVPVLVTEIYNEFIAPNATSPVNIDCKVMEITEENLNNPNRWSFDEAADHIFCLMKNDSYQRFLRSDIYRDLVNISRKKAPVKLSRDIGLRFPNLASFTTNPTKRDANNQQQQQQLQSASTATTTTTIASVGAGAGTSQLAGPSASSTHLPSMGSGSSSSATPVPPTSAPPLTSTGGGSLLGEQIMKAALTSSPSADIVN